MCPLVDQAPNGVFAERLVYVVTHERLYACTFEQRGWWRRVEPKLRGIVSRFLSDLTGVGLTTNKHNATIHLTWRDGARNNLSLAFTDHVLAFYNQLRDAYDRVATSNSPGSATSIADELEKLSELRSQGVIDEADWERAKNLFLGKPTDRREEAVTRLRQLHSHYRAGVLSESEFNSKQWEILSRPM